MNITIQRAIVSDAAAILEHLKIVGGETDNLTFGAEGMPFSVEAEEQFIAQLQNSTEGLMLVAKDGERVVAVATLNRQPRRMNHRGEFGLSVQKAYWNQGIGSRMLEETIAFAKEKKFAIIDLQVLSENERAIHVYKKFGFKKIGTHPKYHKVGDKFDAADFMWLEL